MEPFDDRGPAAELIAGADLILAFGTSLNRWTTRHGRLIGPGTRIIQVDHEAAGRGAAHPEAGRVRAGRLRRVVRERPRQEVAP